MEFGRALIHWHMWNHTIRSERWVKLFCWYGNGRKTSNVWTEMTVSQIKQDTVVMSLLAGCCCYCWCHSV